MNFISHYYLDREQVGDHLFFVGISTPDLVSVFNRTIRLRPHTLPLVMEDEAAPGDLSFYNGVLRHFEGDKVFHSSGFFHEETARICRLMEATLPESVRERTFFVAHILFELLLDKILIEADDTLVPAFYETIEQQPLSELVRLTEWVVATPMPGYPSFLERFTQRRYLLRYTDLDYVLFILRRIMEGVGIQSVAYLGERPFREMVVAYEAGLARRCFPAMAKLNEALCQV